MRNGDVLLLLDGRMLKLLESKSEFEGFLPCVQFIDRDECTYCDFESYEVASNLGQEPTVLATFSAIRGVHLRLNKMARM